MWLVKELVVYSIYSIVVYSIIYIVYNQYFRNVGFRQSEVDIQRWIDIGPIVNFCLGSQCDNTLL